MPGSDSRRGVRWDFYSHGGYNCGVLIGLICRVGFNQVRRSVGVTPVDAFLL
jgi:hypothetical protein